MYIHVMYYNNCNKHINLPMAIHSHTVKADQLLMNPGSQGMFSGFVSSPENYDGTYTHAVIT